MRTGIVVFVAAFALAVAVLRTPAGPTAGEKAAIDNAALDQQIAADLARDGVFIPPAAQIVPKDDSGLWTVSIFTMGCTEYAEAEAFAFLTATRLEAELVNPYSDASQTSCRRVAPGMSVMRGRRSGDAGLVEAWVEGRGPIYLIDKFVVPRR